ncbi:secretion protein HlyD [Echinicola strongylocentroti]|uniref:Secretion protein HlyD n=1 Tax=Echinicola strongylocentroti TaxID=1795355 RepID=A0A2Z4INE4_9BACT|nr:HlyD family efflux transporter periplasmic adaptor subunit [Echinicola strongylocentroti]AWW32354.1 secretion protein HlyD [Echinicola strongylocentroti]
MSNQIFPSDIVKHTSDFHFRYYNGNTLVVYRVILALVIVAMLSLFLIKVDVSIKGAGILKSETPRTTVRSLVSGRIDEVYVKENDEVKEGQVLFTIQSSILNEKNKLYDSQIKELEGKTTDLRRLIGRCRQNRWEEVPSMKSSQYQQEANYFYQKLSDTRSQYAIVQKNYERSKTLYEAGAISELEMDKATLSHDNAKSNIYVAIDQQAAIWQSVLTELEQKLKHLQSEDSQLQQQKEFYRVEAPVAGYIQNMEGIASGAAVAPNYQLGEISPIGGMVAEIMVAPEDIGLLKKGGPVSIQVDSFNYNEWGLLEGEVLSISNDVFMENGRAPYFKVVCAVNQDYLELNNGYKGYLKKGMTLQARFVLTERRLIQLLFDQADDWVNPHLAEK